MAKTYTGSIVAIQSVPSPGNGVIETSSAFGAFTGGYTATLTNAAFNSSGGPLSGSPGHMDYGGKASAVFLGTYGAGQVGDTSAFDWVAKPFIPLSGSTLSSDFGFTNWGWIYILSNIQRSGTTTNVWCNFAAASAGDIST